MKKKEIILVTHGEAHQDLSNPGLTKRGKEQMKKLKSSLPQNFDFVISGIGKRHKEACRILIGRKADLETEIAGVSETLSSDGTNMIFPDGTRIPVDEYEKTRYKEIINRTPLFIKKILKLEKIKGDILMVGGRIAAIGAGVPIQKANSACIYHIWLTPTGKIDIKEQRMLK